MNAPKSLVPILRRSRSLYLLGHWLRRSFGDYREWDFLHLFSLKKSDVFFVQIGANDGQTGDLIYDIAVRNGWSGLVIEPVPEAFARLRQSYSANPQIECYEAAIGDKTGTVQFYEVRERGGDGASRLSSFRREVILKHKNAVADLDDRIESIHVASWRLEDLLAQKNILHIDVFITDTEGYDACVLAQFDLNKHYPSLIIYESVHLSRSEARYVASKLHAYGYYLHEVSGNVVAYKGHFFPKAPANYELGQLKGSLSVAIQARDVGSGTQENNR